uniref:THAP domain-containing protein 1 n=1 Tax=Poecilia latipinna TaxID=48699 RepID=A0A3B3U6I5_9TELE
MPHRMCPVALAGAINLSVFFCFPTDEDLRKQWIVAIRRANLAIKAHTRVCSRHFKREDIQEPESEIGRRRLKKGAVPALFQWNNFSLPLPRPGVWERRKRPLPEDNEEEANPPANVCTKEHDYASAPDPAVVDLILEENDALREEIRQLRKQVESLTLSTYGRLASLAVLHTYTGISENLKQSLTLEVLYETAHIQLKTLVLFRRRSC